MLQSGRPEHTSHILDKDFHVHDGHQVNWTHTCRRCCCCWWLFPLLVSNNCVQPWCKEPFQCEITSEVDSFRPEVSMGNDGYGCSSRILPSPHPSSDHVYHRRSSTPEMWPSTCVWVCVNTKTRSRTHWINEGRCEQDKSPSIHLASQPTNLRWPTTKTQFALIQTQPTKQQQINQQTHAHKLPCSLFLASLWF